MSFTTFLCTVLCRTACLAERLLACTADSYHQYFNTPDILSAPSSSRVGRVICAILGLSAEEQVGVMEGITRLTPVVVATSAAQSFATSISSLFA